MISYILAVDELERLTQELLGKIESGVIVLKGDLAAGKTTLVQSAVKSLGVDDAVTSPTFSLQQCYGEKIFHYDIYNHGLEHFISLGMLEELSKEGLHFVEWGDDDLVEILAAAEINTVVVEIEKRSDNKREYRIDYAHA